MTTNENILLSMLERATGREDVDELATQMFVLVVSKDTDMIPKAQELLIKKIRSHNVTESTRAVAVLEECMTKCGTEFQDEIAKFRFLNELIRLVSKKYLGDETPLQIKQRIMECLLLWTTEFPQKTKIRDAYDMLNKEGAVEHGNSTASVVKRESVLGMDEETFSKLIKSGDPENFKRANLLIQHRVNQEARRSELIVKQKKELEEVQTTVGLLSQMLDAFETEGRDANKGNDTENLIREIYLLCKEHKTVLQRLPELIGTTDESMLADALKINDALQNVMKRYKDVVVHPPSKVATKNCVPAQDLLSELLGEPELSDTMKPAGPVINNLSTNSKPSNAFDDELTAIFSNVDQKTSEQLSTEPIYPNMFLENLDILKPVNVFGSNEFEKQVSTNGQPEKKAFRELREIDKLSDELFKQQVGDRVGSFKKKEPEKQTLNDLAKEKAEGIQTVKSAQTVIPTQHVEITSPFKTSLKNADDDEMLSIPSFDSLEIAPAEECKSNTSNKSENTAPIKHLSEINVDLDELTPCGDERLLLEDEDVKVTLNFTKDRPNKNVSVIVIAVSNKSKHSMEEFHFEASVRKPCKLRLLPATDTKLPPFKQYRPPTPINQVLLLLNPTGTAIDITCIFGYKLGNDPDPVKESVIAKAIPYVD